MTKLTIAAKTLNKILNCVSLATEGRTSNQYASSFLVSIFHDKIEVRANNSLIEAVYTYDNVFELEGEPVVFGIEQFLLSVVSKMRGDIVFEFDGDKVKLIGKKVKHEIALIDPSGFSERLPTPDTLVKIDDFSAFSKLFKNINFAVSTLPDNQILQTFNIHNSEIIATNKVQAILIDKDIGIEKANPSALQFISILKSVDMLNDEDEFWASFDDAIYLKFVMKDGILEYNIALIEGDYPSNIKGIIEQAEKQEVMFKFVAEKQELTNALDVSMLYYNKAGTTGEAQFLSIVSDKNEIYFSSGVTQLSDMRQKIDTKELISPNEFTFHLDPKDLMEFVKLVEGNVVLIIYANTEDFVFLYDTNDPSLKYIQSTMDKPGAK